MNGLDGHNVIQTTKWSWSVNQYLTPPIQQANENLAVSNLEKQAMLRKELLSSMEPITDNIINNKQAFNLIERKEKYLLSGTIVCLKK